MARVIRGERLPPLDDLERWCKLLHLTGSAREAFLDDAALAHCPDRVVALVDRLRQQVEALEE